MLPLEQLIYASAAIGEACALILATDSASHMCRMHTVFPAPGRWATPPNAAIVTVRYNRQPHRNPTPLRHTTLWSQG